MAEVSLLVNGELLKANRDVLCENCEYFRAMFSGNYVENDENVVPIEGLDAGAMKTILLYINTGVIDLKDHTVYEIGELATAANFLQLKPFIKPIENELPLKKITPENCMEIMNITQNTLFTNSRVLSTLEEIAGKCAALSFKSMMIENIPDLSRLCWFLSHPYLDASSEVDAFMFGYSWVLHNIGDGADAMLDVLHCLDVKTLTLNDLSRIKISMLHYSNSLATKVIDCLHKLVEFGCDFSEASVKSSKTYIECSEKVYNDTLKLLKASRSRLQKCTLVVPVNETDSLDFYAFRNSKFERWLSFTGICENEEHVPEISVIEINKRRFVAPWGLTKMVVINLNWTWESLRVYDVLTERWSCHDVDMSYPETMYVVGDMLHLVESRQSVSIYDLKESKYTDTTYSLDKVSDDLINGICVYKNTVYTTACNKIYEREDFSSKGNWNEVVDAGFKVSGIAVYKGYIYCTQKCSEDLYRFKLGDDAVQKVASLENRPVHICKLGDRLLFISCSIEDKYYVEEYDEEVPDDPKVLCCVNNDNINKNNFISCLPLVIIPRFF